MPRVPIRRFGLGLVVSGPKESAPAGSLRRARGIRSTNYPAIRSRPGSTLLATLPAAAHSLYRFGDVRWAGAGTVLYREGVSVRTGLDSSRLAFVSMPPTVGVTDALFVAGGGTLFKADAAGVTSQWGIDAPTSALTAADNGAGAMAAGTYKYSVTYKNRTTGHRSNARSILGDASVTAPTRTAATRRSRRRASPASSAPASVETSRRTPASIRRATTAR